MKKVIYPPLLVLVFRLLIALPLSIMLLTKANADAHTEYQQALTGWANVLEKFVDSQGRTDFAGVEASPEQLQRFVDAIADYGPESHPQHFTTQQQVLAYHINSYNAMAMHGVIERGIPKGFTTLFKRASFFILRKVRIDGKKTSLYDYENKVIRPLGEPRIHFALNCMVKDCPRLPSTPFVAERLEQQLEQVSREFFSKERHLKIDHDKKRVYVSAILDFYTEDFVESGRKGDLPQYINRYVKQPLPADYSVSYLKYDWRINSQPE